jgi:serine protease Do
MSRILTSTGAILALAVTCAIPSIGQAQTREAYQKNASRIMEVFVDVVARPSQSTARILCAGKEVALGTVVDADGYLLTKYSELTDNDPLVRLKDGTEYKAKIVGVHKPYDVALLKVEAKGLKPIEWRKGAPEPGDWLATPGLGEKPLYIGVVSVAPRKVSMRDFPAPPVPAAGSGFLGVQLKEAEGKVAVAEVTKDSAAEKAGLKVEDFILTIEGKTVKDIPGMIAIVSGKKAGEVIKVKIKRGETEMELTATLGKRPSSPLNRGDFQNNLGSELSKTRIGFPTVLQHDTVIKPIDCGGPIVDLSGKAVGVNIARAGRVESYAMPVEAILQLLPDLKSGKLPPPK